MRPSLSSSTTTPNRSEKGCNEGCLHHRRRRADSAPFTASKRQKTDDNDARRGDREPARAPSSGFFVRLARYIPIVNRFVAEEDVGTNVDLDVGADAGVDDDTDDVESSVLKTCDRIRTTQDYFGEEGEGRDRDGGEDGGEDEKKVPETFVPVDVEKKKNVQQQQQQKDTLEDAVDVSVPPVTRSTLPAGQGKKKFATRLSPPLKCRRSPPCESKQERESSSAVMDEVRRIREKREGIFGSSRPPQTPNAAGTQERQVPTSPSPLDVARKIIKEKKKISLDEFERLQHQLHEMVGTTPHEQLTQAYLLMDLGLLVTPSCPGVKSELSFVPGSIAAQNRGRSAARSEQKRGSGDEVKSDMPSGKRPRTHETEPVRRPGATQRGLLTREERRLRKPRSSPLLPRRDAATSKMCSDALARSIILVLNKVQSPPAEEALKPTPSTTVSGTPRSATAASTDAPAPSSSQVTSITSASTPTGTVPEQQEMKTIGGLGVILPIGVEGMKHAGADDKDTRVRFAFSPSPSMREPSVKVLNQKTTKDDGKKSVAAEEATKLSADMPAVTPAASLSGAANPLARFMQLKPGQWKCTGCRVLNEATSGRCPCCGTARSDGGSAAKARTALLKTTEKCPLTGLSFGTTTEATAAADKGTATPAAGSITPALTSFSTTSSPQPMESTAFCWAPATTSFGTASSAFGSSSSGGANSSSTAGGFGSTSAAAPSTPYGSSTSSLQAAPPFLFGGFSQAQTATTPTNTQPTLAFSASSAPAPNGFETVVQVVDSALHLLLLRQAVDSAMAHRACTGGPSGGFGTIFDAPETGSEFGNGPPSSDFLPPTPTSASPTPTSAFGFTPAAPGFGTIPNTAFGTEAPTSGFRDPTADAVSAPDDGTCSMDIDYVHADSTFGMDVGYAPAPASPFGTVPSTSFNATTSAFGFGAPAAGGFGAPTDGRFGMNGGYAPAPASSFGTDPSIAFGATPSASNFGALAAGGFGAPTDGRFGMNGGYAPVPAPVPAQASTFGTDPSIAFGAMPPAFNFGSPAAGGSGAPTDGRFGTNGGYAPAPVPAQASTFRAIPNASFGATPSASGFGAPAAGAFIAPSAVSFSIGVAPEHAKGRRILKAKSRKRRTS